MRKPRSTTQIPRAPTATPGTSQSAGDELVLTPGGWRPRSQAQRLEHGQHISGRGGRLRIIETATGSVVQDLGEISKQKHGRPA
jgi:hypothetical protein